MIFEIIFIIILIGVVLTCLSYSKEGDILTLQSSMSLKHKKTHKNTSTSKDQIVDRLHSLLIYKEGYVRWNKFIIISLFASCVILKFLDIPFSVGKLIMLSIFIFMCIDLPNRWAHSHIQSGIIQEASILFGQYKVL